MTSASIIIVNGQDKPWPSAKSLTELIMELCPASPHVAVAVNNCIVPRSRHASMLVQPGDRVEIVHPVGGG